MKKEVTRLYMVKSLIPGERVEGLEKDKTYIAIPDRGYKDAKRIRAKFEKEGMVIPDWGKALKFRRFHDQYRQGEFYVLGYFEWEPTEKEQEYDFVEGTAIPRA